MLLSKYTVGPSKGIITFDNYNAFQSKFADYGIAMDRMSGAGWNIDDKIAIYCLNTAICSSGGFNDLKDKGRLAIDTRSLQKWISECETSTKILLMHHPIEELAECELPPFVVPLAIRVFDRSLTILAA